MTTQPTTPPTTQETSEQTTPDAATDDGLLVRSHLDFTVVGLGASAGGIKALITFFERMPENNGMAFVVVLHLSATHESHLDRILQRTTTMPVLRVVEATPIEANHVYVISPALHLSMSDGHLRVSEARRMRGRPTAIDVFFRTLAEVHQQRAVSMILSGTGSDGAVGVARIQECGGLTFAQEPADAEEDGMPRAAISTGAIDFVLPVADMPAKLITLVESAKHIRMPPDADLDLPTPPVDDARELQLFDEALRDIMVLVRARTRHDFQHYKRGTVLRRIERRMQVHALVDVPTYRSYLRENPEETGPLLQDLLISVTNFFRDRSAYDFLEREALPALFRERDAKEQVRIWVAGCATGEEAYSIAMVAFEIAETMPRRPEIQVFATDIDERAILVGRAGLYPSSIATDVSPQRLRRFFTKEQNQYRVIKSLRESVLFAVHNVLRDPPFSRLDMVCCRNLLIYLDRDVQNDVLQTFRFALKSNGILFLGTSESAESIDNSFVAIDKKERVYRASAEARPRYLVFDNRAAVDPRDLPASDAKRDPQRTSYAQRHAEALDQLAAPSILVDAEYNILHVSDHAARFLHHSGGVPSHQLLNNVSPPLRLELRTALFKAAQSGRSVEARAVRFERGGKPSQVNITILPLAERQGELRNFLVVFTEVQDTLRDVDTGDSSAENLVVAQLEGEIKRLKEYLQETVEDAETSTEELKASNEELQAINEELRSTTEELETSKEELQSMNEELTTVNYELKMKFDETAKVNDDLRNLIASTDIATVFVDNAFRIKRFTPRALDVFSLIPGDVGRPLLDINHRLDYEDLPHDVETAFDALKTTERRVDSNDGRHYLARVLPYRTNDDKIEGAVITFIDVTALHYAEERARAGEERLRLAAETTKDYAIITMDERGTITTWNAGAERVFGHSELEAIGHPIALIFTPEDRANDLPAIEMSVARAHGRAEDERWHLRKDGKRIFVSGVMSTVATDGSRGFAKIARDITGTKEEQAGREAMLVTEQLARTRSEAAGKLKDELLAVMSHELKHPLNLILVNAELLTRLPATKGEPGVERAVQVIRKAVIGQGKIIDDLLDLSRSRTGKLTLELAGANLAAIVEPIINSLASDAGAHDVALRFSAADDLEAVLCDPIRVDQVVWNLLSNALKFTPPGGRVDVRIERDGAFAKLAVTDTGKGIAPAFLPQVFDMFTQEHGGMNRTQGGLGIGLAIVRELVEAQGGHVEASSAGVGRGASFRVWLPLVGKRTEQQRRETRESPGLGGLRILIVDDSRDALAGFVELLKLEGAEAVGAGNGQDALALLDTRPFDVLVSDLAMPESDGFWLIEEVRKRPALATLTAIALSGFGREKDRLEAIDAGFDAHLGKPASIEELARVMRTVRRKSRG